MNKEELEIKKLDLEIQLLEKQERSFYYKYGDLFRLVVGFVLTGIIGSLIASMIQAKQDEDKSRSLAIERFAAKCEETLDKTESVLASRLYLQLRILSILEYRSKGDFAAYRDIEDETFEEYLESVHAWNVGLNMNRTVVARVFGPDVSAMFYGGGPNVPWESSSITLKFVHIHREVMQRWRSYKAGESFEMNILMQRHWDLSEQTAAFYDTCLDQILAASGQANKAIE